MGGQRRRVLVVGGGTAGSVLAARVSDDPLLSVTLVEAGPDHDAYDAGVLEPARAAEVWTGVEHLSVTPTIPSGNTYLGCVMVAERVARKMTAGESGTPTGAGASARGKAQERPSPKGG